MTPVISVVIPTHNPRMDYLARVIEALRHQTLPREQWELLVVDNSSRVPLKAGAVKGGKVGRCEGDDAENCIDLSWHPSARIIREEKLGLTFARLRGFAEAKGEMIVMVDDDNVLDADYLANAVKIAGEHKELGAFGGKCLPEFETQPEPWMEEFLPLLALRDHGEKEIIAGDTRSADGSRRIYPDQAAPIGAGMVVRREAAAAYAERLRRGNEGWESEKWKGDGSAYAFASAKDSGVTRAITDRKGDSLASAGDNDLVFTILRDGWKVGYFPQLTVTHLIPSNRLTVGYFARANRGVQRSWVEVLRKHDACPWPLISRGSVPARKARAWLVNKAWSPAGRVRWNGCCGNFEGLVSS